MDVLGGMLAERLGVPCVYAWWVPMLAARDFLFNTTENPLPRLPGWLNRGGVQTYKSVLWLATRGALSRAREDFGVGRAGLTPPLRAAVARGETLLLAYSDELLPRSREWPANVETTGWCETRCPTASAGRRRRSSRASLPRGESRSTSALAA